MQESVETGAFAYGFLVTATNVSLFNCTVDQCNGGLVSDGESFSIGTGSSNALLVNCSATNSTGIGFAVSGLAPTVINCIANNNEQGYFIGESASGLNKATFINCTATYNVTEGFYIQTGTGFAFRDCTATYNATGFTTTEFAELNAINSFSSNNTNFNYANGFFALPNVQGVASTNYVTGVNISA